jgi:hypothetical protein
MKKLEKILAENMRRFGTKNLNEDEDQNNNGYPDNTEVPNSKSEWLTLVKQDLAAWNSKQHPDDRMGIQDWIGEVGPKIHGWVVSRNQYGDWDVEPTSPSSANNNEFSVLIDALETNLESYSADEITFEADDDSMEVHVDIYSTENKKQITKIINDTINANSAFMIDKQSITREKDAEAENGGLMLSFDIIKK